MAVQCLVAAERVDDEDLLLEGHHVVGNALFWGGELAASRVHLEEVLARYRPEHHRSHLVRFAQNPRLTSMFPYANTLVLQGEPDRAVVAAEEALALARSLGHAFSQAMVLQTLAWVRALRDDVARARAHAEALVELATARGFPVYVPIGEIPRGWAMIRGGEVDAGLARARAAIDGMTCAGMAVSRTISSSLLARALRAAGRPEEAAREVEAGLAASRATGERAYFAELLAGAGKIEEAIDVARSQGAHALIARITEGRS